MIGAHFGNYVLAELLGRGGMGTVYRAEHPRIGRHVAIKVLANHLSRQPAFTDRFATEARALATIGHPNIIDIFDFGQTPAGEFYYVMELLEGQELGHVLADAHGPLRPAAVQPYLDEISAALQAAHQRGIVHRDLKPANIFVTSTQPVRLKILDFGVAKVFGDAAQTSAGVIVGTPTYMAPEQAAGLGRPIGPAADIYSLGVLLFQMLAGRPPFLGSSPVMVMAAHLRDAPPALADLVPACLPGLAELVDLCLRKDPLQRPATVQEVCRLFAKALSERARRPAGAARATPGAATPSVAEPPAPQAADETLDLATSVPAEAAATEAAATEAAADTAALVKDLLQQIQRRGDFPAISESIGEIHRNASIMGNASARQLAASIMKDYSLSTKLLQVVNSAYYERCGGRIGSLPRAVVMLGFEHVRDTAIGLTIFPKLKNNPKVEQLVDSTVSSLLAGLMAHKVAGLLRVKKREDAFACGMLHTLGRQLVLYYLPERHDRITATQRERGASEAHAARSELGVSYEELGTAVARRWRLSDNVIEAMRPYEHEDIARPANDRERLRAAAALANDLCEIAATTAPEQREAALEGLAARYEACVRTDAKILAKIVDGAVEALSERFDGVVDYDLSKCHLLHRVAGTTPPPQGTPPDLRQQPPDVVLRARTTRLAEGFAAIERALAEEHSVDELLRLVLDTTHHGLGLARVLLWVLTADGSRLEVRAGLGEGSAPLLHQTVAVSRTGRDLISQILFDRQDRTLTRRELELARSSVPVWCGSGGSRVFLYPVEVFRKPAALLYGEGDALDAEQHGQLAKLRTFLAAGMRVGRARPD